MPNPKMKQEYDLTPADFERFPAWVSVHHYDSDEPWHDRADEDAVRPWTGALPFAESRGYVAAAATFTLADGSVHAGFCHSIPDDWDAPFQVAPARDGAPAKMATWSSLGKTKKNVFPIRFEAEPGLANGIVSGELTGFCDGQVLHGHPPKLVA